jgi:hypothetical protein
MSTGVVQWSGDYIGQGGIMLVDNKILVLTESGEVILAERNPAAYRELGRFAAMGSRCWNSAAVCDGRLYVRSTTEAAAFDLSLPPLRFERLALVSGDKLRLTLSTADGRPITSDRLESLEIRGTTNAALPLRQWTRLTNALVLANGKVRVEGLDARLHQRTFFIAREPGATVSGLRLGPPQRVAGNKLRLDIATADDTPITADRLAGLEVRAANDLSLPGAQWTVITNALVLANGRVRVDDLDIELQPRGYYRVVEQE